MKKLQRKMGFLNIEKQTHTKGVDLKESKRNTNNKLNDSKKMDMKKNDS